MSFHALTQRPGFGRRQVAACGLALALATGTSAAAQRLPPDPDSVRGLAMSVRDGFTLATVGDIIITRPISQTADPAFAGMLSILRQPDVTFGNFETNLIDIRDFDGHPQAEFGGGWLISVPTVAEDVRTLGFDLVSRANNHTTDWGLEGMWETGKHLDAVGLVHAGAGRTRAAARAGRFVDTPAGRVAVVSMASSFTPLSRAMDPMREAPGRPGLSALRTTRFVLITEEEMAALRAIRAAQPEGSVLDPETESDDELRLFGVAYRVSDHRGFEHEMNEVDLREILQAIGQAKRNADFVIATIHAHNPGNWSDAPPDFLVELAHRAIDAGADAFVGHGPHQLRGIEVYRGKPIFYSLANFAFQVELLEPVARDLYETYGVDPNEVNDAEFNRRWLDIYFDDAVWYESVIAESRFANGRVEEIRLHPLELGYDLRGGNRGVPHIARPEAARKILERLQRLSAPYGTTIEVGDGIGVILTSTSTAGRPPGP